jgi:CheY-like chemotaxis protein
MNILRVDDDWQSLVSLGRFLSSEGHFVEAHPIPQSALEIAKEQEFDLLVSDFRLPGMDGLELIEKVRLLRPSVRTILYTGLSSEAMLERANRLGVDRILGKPIYIQNLLDAILSLSLPMCGSGPAELRIHKPEPPEVSI